MLIRTCTLSKTVSRVCLSRIPMRSIPVVILASLFFSTLLAGCESTPSKPALSTSGLSSLENYKPVYDLEGMEEETRSFPTILFRRSEAPRIGAYDRFIIGDIDIRLNRGSSGGADGAHSEGAVPQRDLVWMADYLRAAITYQLSRAGYMVGPGHANKAMVIDFTISGIEVNTDQSLPSRGGSNGQNVEQSQSMMPSIRTSLITIEGRFANAKTKNQPDAVAINQTRGAQLEAGRWWSTWEDIERAMDRWAVGIREAVDATRTYGGP
jgi:hypothetical protein